MNELLKDIQRLNNRMLQIGMLLNEFADDFVKVNRLIEERLQEHAGAMTEKATRLIDLEIAKLEQKDE